MARKGDLKFFTLKNHWEANASWPADFRKLAMNGRRAEYETFWKELDRIIGQAQKVPPALNGRLRKIFESICRVNLLPTRDDFDQAAVLVKAFCKLEGSMPNFSGFAFYPSLRTFAKKFDKFAQVVKEVDFHAVKQDLENFRKQEYSKGWKIDSVRAFHLQSALKNCQRLLEELDLPAYLLKPFRPELFEYQKKKGKALLNPERFIVTANFALGGPYLTERSLRDHLSRFMSGSDEG